MPSRTEKLTRLALMTAAAMLIGRLESLIPLPLPVPGIKLGLANSAVLLALYTMDEKSALALGVCRAVLSGLMFTGVSAMLYALAGTLLSWCVMCLTKRCRAFSVIGVSVLGGMAHNLAQLLLAAAIVRTKGLLVYLPVLLFAGTIAGLAVGIVSALLTERLKASNI